ncbi:hypothetical protein [Streptomyces cyaneofuscatus]|uniref:hypothetical protein n=1 Tax=Streptomyces cyaneofuscatus TaxID=66883 RepID=UPI003318F045
MVISPVLRSMRRRFIRTAWQAPGMSKLLTGGDRDAADLGAVVAAAPGVITSESSTTTTSSRPRIES